MRAFSKEQKDLLVHLFKGGSVKHAGDIIADNVVKLAMLTLTDDTELELDTFLEDYVMHFTKEEGRIQELEEQLRIQSEELQKALAKNKKLTPSRTHRPQLKAEEVREIEDALAKGATTPGIEATYNVSATVISKIRRGKHTHSIKKVDASNTKEK